MTTLLTYNWFWLLLFGSVSLAALLLLLLIVYHLARIANVMEAVSGFLERIERIMSRGYPDNESYEK